MYKSETQNEAKLVIDFFARALHKGKTEKQRTYSNKNKQFNTKITLVS